jgi:hypothetical protein
MRRWNGSVRHAALLPCGTAERRSSGPWAAACVGPMGRRGKRPRGQPAAVRRTGHGSSTAQAPLPVCGFHRGFAHSRCSARGQLLRALSPGTAAAHSRQAWCWLGAACATRRRRHRRQHLLMRRRPAQASAERQVHHPPHRHRAHAGLQCRVVSTSAGAVHARRTSRRTGRCVASCAAPCAHHRMDARAALGAAASIQHRRGGARCARCSIRPAGPPEPSAMMSRSVNRPQFRSGGGDPSLREKGGRCDARGRRRAPSATRCRACRALRCRVQRSDMSAGRPGAESMRAEVHVSGGMQRRRPPMRGVQRGWRGAPGMSRAQQRRGRAGAPARPLRRAAARIGGKQRQPSIKCPPSRVRGGYIQAPDACGVHGRPARHVQPRRCSSPRTSHTSPGAPGPGGRRASVRPLPRPRCRAPPCRLDSTSAAELGGAHHGASAGRRDLPSWSGCAGWTCCGCAANPQRSRLQRP